MRVIHSIKDIAEHYDLFLIDQWGVLHDGRFAYKEAINALQYLKNINKTLIIISNSSQR